MDKENLDPRDIKYGLMVIDPSQEGDMLDIKHFVGYWCEPTIKDVEALREELRTDESFGLTEIIDDLDILQATEDIVNQFVELIKNNYNE